VALAFSWAASSVLVWPTFDASSKVPVVAAPACVVWFAFAADCGAAGAAWLEVEVVPLLYVMVVVLEPSGLVLVAWLLICGAVSCAAGLGWSAAFCSAAFTWVAGGLGSGVLLEIASDMVPPGVRPPIRPAARLSKTTAATRKPSKFTGQVIVLSWS
jgi:hypothetical protein